MLSMIKHTLQHEGEVHVSIGGSALPAPKPVMQPKSAFIAVKREDGSLSITAMLVLGRGNILPRGAAWVNGFAGWWARDLTDEVIDDELDKACSPPTSNVLLAPWAGKPVSWRVIDAADLPTDRTYRNAWMDTGAAIEHDMEKAKGIHRDLVRKLRAPELDDLDAEWMKAIGQGDSPAALAIEEKRQAWRDAPADPSIEAATSVEDLKALLDVQTQAK